jgi:hypothetical protein
MTALETLTGTVVKINATGFQLDTEPGTWRNPSKFADPPPTLPTLGQRVRVRVDGKGFARAIEPLDGDPPLPHNGHDRDQTITRLAVLKAAARFLADKPEAKSPDVLTVAERWEAWVSR